MSIYRRIATGLLLMTVAQVAAASAWVDVYDGPDQAYRVTRDGKQLRVGMFLPLRPGDEVVVLRPEFDMVIAYVDGRQVTVTAARSPYLVEAVAEAPGRVDNLLYWARTLVQDFRGGTDVSRVNLISRRSLEGPALLADPVQKVSGNVVTVLVPGAPPSEVSLNGRALEFTAVPAMYSRVQITLPEFGERAQLAIDGRQVTLERVSPDAVPRCEMAPQPGAEALREAACAFATAVSPGWALVGLQQLAELDDPKADYLNRVYAHVIHRRMRRGS